MIVTVSGAGIRTESVTIMCSTFSAYH